MPLSPVTFSQFHGGLTDLYLGAPVHKAQVLQNFLIDEIGKPYVRNGTSIFAQRLPYTSNQPTGIYLGSEPFSTPLVVTGPHAYYLKNDGTWGEITGANTSFLPGKTSSFEASVLWRKQLISVSGTNNGLPQAIYSTSYPSSPAYQALTIGMPSAVGGVSISPTSALPYVVTISISSGTAFEGDVYEFSSQHINLYVQQTVSGGPVIFVNTGFLPVAPQSGTLTKVSGSGDSSITYSAYVYTSAAYAYQFFLRFIYFDYAGTQFEYWGNPVTSSTLTVQSAPPSMSFNIPVLINSPFTNYQAGSITADLTFTSDSTVVTYANASGTIVPGMQFYIPGLTPIDCYVKTVNPSFHNFIVNAAAVGSGTSIGVPMSQVALQLYRTVNGGTTYFLCGVIPNGVTTFNDIMPDWLLQLSPTIYTSGGAAGWDAPPGGIIALTQVNDFFWYATKDTLYQSIQGNPGAVPDLFSSVSAQKIVGLSDVISFPILFCDQSIYRIEGTFDSFGNNGFVQREISKVAGCVSNRSIVKIPQGLVWFGNGGIYFTDGDSVIKLTKDLNTSYQAWNSPSTVGVYDPVKNMVYWTVNSFPNGPIDTLLVLHLAYGLSEQSVFSTIGSPENLLPVTLAFSSSQDVYDSSFPDFFNKVIFSDKRGYLLYFDPNSSADVWIDTRISPSEMVKKTILYDYTTVGLEQGIGGFRKFNPDFSIEIDASTSVSMQVKTRRDDGGGWSGDGGSPAAGRGATGSPGGGNTGNPGIPEIRQDGAITWGVTDVLWGNDPGEFPWDDFKVVDGKRSFPAGQLRACHRQLKFTNSFTIIIGSDVYGTCSVVKDNGTGNVYVTLDSSASWPTDLEGYWIAFDSDGYNQTYEILFAVGSLMIKISDPYELLSAETGLQWEIKGFRKFERPRLLSFTLYADVEGPTYGQATQPIGANAT